MLFSVGLLMRVYFQLLLLFSSLSERQEGTNRDGMLYTEHN